jgi:hypothetical protein
MLREFNSRHRNITPKIIIPAKSLSSFFIAF